MPVFLLAVEVHCIMAGQLAWYATPFTEPCPLKQTTDVRPVDLLHRYRSHDTTHDANLGRISRHVSREWSLLPIRTIR